MFKRISIIIPALNEEKNIGQCIEALLAMEGDHLGREIIVVDNGSSDKTVELARKHDVEVIVKTGVAIAALRNIGAAKASGDLLAFVDADCVVAKDWLNNALLCFSRQVADAVGSFHAIPESTGRIGRTAELIQQKKTGSGVSYIPSGNMFVKAGCFKAVNGFDESLETNEDVDICNRLQKSGCKLFLDSSIKSTHLGSPKGMKELFLRELWHGKNACTVFYRDLKKVRNLRVVLYSVFNLLFMLGITGGILLFFVTRSLSLFTVSLCLYLFLNLFVAYLDWHRIRKDFISLFYYVMIYGIARSVSILKSML